MKQTAGLHSLGRVERPALQSTSNSAQSTPYIIHITVEKFLVMNLSTTHTFEKAAPRRIPYIRLSLHGISPLPLATSRLSCPARCAGREYRIVDAVVCWGS